MSRRFTLWCALLLFALCSASCGSPVKKAGDAPCGNGTVDFGETCDFGIAEGQPGACPLSCTSASACEAVVLVGDRLQCSAECTMGEPSCGIDDGCCPSRCSASEDDDCGSTCGNGTIDPGETCDGDCPTECTPSDSCTRATLAGDSSSCDAACELNPISLCIDGDSCCPQGCDLSTDGDCMNVCGDGIVEGSETCDGDCPVECDDLDPCTTDFLVGAPQSCDVECRHNRIDDCNPVTCGEVTCAQGEICDAAGSGCVEACTTGDCAAGELCNMETGLCEVNNCPGEDPNQCDTQSAAPLWDPIKCICAACVSDNDCDTAAGEVCNAAGQCFACETACDANMPGICGNQANGTGGMPYCINDCCVECVGAADCADGEFCLDGFCGQPPNCQVDPTVCPNGYECNQATGQCDPPTTGQNCDPTDPSSCPMGTFCDPTSMTCGGGGGGLGCGLCNPDCTCDGGLSCDGFFCSGCSVIAQDCPDGQACISLASNNAGMGTCVPL